MNLIMLLLGITNKGVYMKKKLKLLVLTGLLAVGTTASAYIEVGVAKQEYASTSITGFNVGLGSDTYWDSGFYSGFDFDVNFGELYSEQVLGLGMDINLGWSFFDSLALYGLIGYNSQSIYNTSRSEFNTYLGLGYGAGVNYKITDNFAVDLKYKKATLEYFDTTEFKFSGSDFDYTSLGINLKISF